MIAAAAALVATGAATAHAAVLRVGTFNGIPGQYSSIQAAVDHAAAGDWILVAPGDYHETGNRVPKGAAGDDQAGAAVLITTPNLHLRGMDRNTTILDGTKPGSPTCSSNPADQDFGPLDSNGKPSGRNGLLVFEANGVSVENLSACNFLTGDVAGGNQIWFDGGAATGTQKLGAWRGAYLSATATYYKDSSSPVGNYGIYVSNTYGPGVFTQVYANNQADSAFYVGACPDCNTILDHAHGEYSDLGYSGTNSGGHLIIQNSEFNQDQSGFVTNSQNNDDAPEPQVGACPAGETGPTGTGSCWMLRDNSIHDNNNPNVPTSGSAAAAPVGTGVVLAGGRFDTVTGNDIFNNGAWGVLDAPYPDTEQPPPVAHCRGGQGSGSVCFFDDYGNEVAGNRLSNNGFFGNPTNGDLAEISNPENPGNCWHDNVDAAAGGQPTSDPPAIQSPPHSTCGIPDSGEPLSSPLGAEAACDTQILGPCPLPAPLVNYPRVTKVALAPVPPQATMPDACAGVPQNPWCPNNPASPGAYAVPGLPYVPGIFGSSSKGNATSGPRAVCLSHRRFVIHLPRRVRSARVYVNGHRVRVRGRRGRLRAVVDLRRLPRRTVVVRLVERLRNGHRVVRHRRYHTCVRRR